MPNLGFGELLLIVIAVILFVRPDDLPKFFRNIGRLYNEAQRHMAKFKSYTHDTLNEIARTEPPEKEPAKKVDESVDRNKTFPNDD